MGEMILEGFNGLVDELAVWRGVPPEPVAGVAVEAIAVKNGWLMVMGNIVEVCWGFLGWLSLGIFGDWRWGCGFHGACNHVSKDFTIFQRKNRS